MKCFFIVFSIILAGIGTSRLTYAEDLSSWGPEIKAALLQGQIVSLPHRPGETAGKPDRRFVSMAKIMKAPRQVIWEVVIDKDNTEKFLDGVLESRIISQKENEIILEQKTVAGGPKSSYQYTLKYTLTPMTRAAFTFIKGEIRNVEGAWWILDAHDEQHKLVVYSLHIDPGGFAPQFIVKKGIRNTVPSTLESTEVEVQRRVKENSR